MPYSKDFSIPTEEELTVEEVCLSHSALRAGAIHLGKYCENQNNEFMLCRKELNDPRKCLNEGKMVTKCTLEFFRKVKKHCCKEFNQFANCLNTSSSDMSFKYCRNTQAAFDKCALEKLNLEKPPFGWQCEVHIHEAKRPKPEPDLEYYPDAPEKFPFGEVKIEEPKYGFRGKNL